MRKYLILLASGTGSRFGADCPKQYVKVAGRMILEHTLEACDCGLFDECVLVVSDNYVDFVKGLVSASSYGMNIRVVVGGMTRLESFANGICAIDENEAYVVVHNAAQPFVKKETLSMCIAGLENHAATISGIPSTYVQMYVDEKNCIRQMLPRERLFTDMGVEGLRLTVAREVVQDLDGVFTNLVGKVVEKNLGKVLVYQGDPGNFKITYPEDILTAERIFQGGSK